MNCGGASLFPFRSERRERAMTPRSAVTPVGCGFAGDDETEEGGGAVVVRLGGAGSE